MHTLFSASRENYRFFYCILLFLSSIYLMLFVSAARAQTNIPPIAKINSNTSVQVGRELQFSSENSTDADGNITQYLWNFGDNTGSSAANPVHFFQTSGNFEVTLTVTDDAGASDQQTIGVSVIYLNEPVIVCDKPKCPPNPDPGPNYLYEIFYRGSAEGEKITTADEFWVKIYSSFLQIQTVAYRIDGTQWNTAELIDGAFVYNFGLLEAGVHLLEFKLDNVINTRNFFITVALAQVDTPNPVTTINLPTVAQVELDFLIDWDAVDAATSYKVYVNGDEQQQLTSNSTTLNLPIIGPYSIQIAACNTVGCSELSPVQNVTVYHTEIDFNNYVIGPYAGVQDVAGSAELFEGGRGLSLQGNVWKQIPYNYTVSVNTILAFDFISTEQGGLHGIGLSPNLDENLANTFQIFGTENCCINEFNDYPGGGIKKHYEIMIGQYYLGEFNHLFFIMDDDSGQSSPADSTFTAVHFFEEQRVPPVATGLNVTSLIGRGQSFEATWNSVPEALSYRVNINGELLQIVDTPSVTLSFDVLGNYTIGIQACNDKGCNVEAESQLVQVLPPPAKVTSIRSPDVEKVKGRDFSLSWDNFNDATQYKLFIDTILQPNEANIPLATLNIANAGEYALQVQACSQFGCGELSDNYIVKIIAPPAAVENVTLPALAATSKAIALSWNTSINANYYEVAIAGQLYTTSQVNSAELSFSQAGNYAVTIRACNQAGCGEYSQVATVTAQALPTVVFDITVPNNRQVGEPIPVSWLPVADASSYELYLDSDLLFTVNGIETQIEVAFEGTHTFQVKPCSTLGCGPLSSPVNLQVSANQGPSASDTTLIFTQQSPLIVQDLDGLVTDPNGIDWGSLHLVKPAQGQITIANSVLTIDYAAEHLDGEQTLEYRVNDLLGAPSNKGLIRLIVKVLQVPDLPAELSIAELSPSEQLNFSWQTPQGNDIRYNIEHQLNDKPWQLLKEAGVERLINIAQPINGSHRFRVKACRITHNLCSEFAQSTDIVIANVARPVNNILSPTVDAQGQIRLQWIPSTNANYYNIQQQKNQQEWQPLQQNVVGTMLMVPVDGNGEYKFSVAACNEIGCSNAAISPVAELANSPEAPSVVTSVKNGNSNTLNWSQVGIADWYLVQMKNGTQWQGVNGNDSQMQYSGNTLQITPATTADVRVQACNTFGCSEFATLAVISQDTNTPINAFFADKSVLSGAGHETSLHWEVRNAAEVSIVSDQGQNYTNLPASGSLMVMPELTTRYSLNAKANMQAQVYSQSVDVVVGDGGDDVVATLPNNPNISPIVSSILIEPSGNRYFGDIQGGLIGVDDTGNVLWQEDDVGMIYSPPFMAANSQLYFTATSNNGHGRLCNIELTGNNLHCVELPQPVIGAPVIDDTQALLVDLYGTALSVNLNNDTVTTLSQLPNNKQVRSTPLLTPNNALVIRTTTNDIYMLDLSAGSGAIGWTQSLAGEQ